MRCPASPRHALLAENLGKPSLEQIGVDGIADGDPINRVNLLYLLGVDRIHRIDRTHDVGSIDPDPV